MEMKILNFRLSEFDFEAMKDLAAKEHMSLSEFIRHLCHDLVKQEGYYKKKSKDAKASGNGK